MRMNSSGWSLEYRGAPSLMIATCCLTSSAASLGSSFKCPSSNSVMYVRTILRGRKPVSLSETDRPLMRATYDRRKGTPVHMEKRLHIRKLEQRKTGNQVTRSEKENEPNDSSPAS